MSAQTILCEGFDPCPHCKADPPPGANANTFAEHVELCRTGDLADHTVKALAPGETGIVEKFKVRDLGTNKVIARVDKLRYANNRYRYHAFNADGDAYLGNTRNFAEAMRIGRAETLSEPPDGK